MRRAMPLLVALGCGPSPDDPMPPNPHARDGELRLHHLQLRATHNSTHLRPAIPIDPSHDYAMPTLTAQVADHGIRGFELDLHWSLDEEAFHVFHLPVVDDETTCLRLTDCLDELRRWSVTHPWHAPLVVWMEPKDDVDVPATGYGPIGDRWDVLEREILSVWPRGALLTPDDVRGAAPDLPTALAAEGWPTLGEARGRLVVALLDSGADRDAYVGPDPTLAGRLLFVDSSSPEDPFAALFKDGDPSDLAQKVDQGLLVAANVDGADADDDANAARLASYVDAGAHLLATDFPTAVPGRTYQLTLPGDAVVGCNPRTAPPDCTPEDAEAAVVREGL